METPAPSLTPAQIAVLSAVYSVTEAELAAHPGLTAAAGSIAWAPQNIPERVTALLLCDKGLLQLTGTGYNFTLTDAGHLMYCLYADRRDVDIIGENEDA